MHAPRLFFVVTLLLAAMASAWSQDLPLQIKVLSGESRQFQGPLLDPPNCNWRDISAYCFGSSPQTYVENTMVVQEPDGKSLEIACTVYNQWSNCTSLPVPFQSDARRGCGGRRDSRDALPARVFRVRPPAPPAGSAAFPERSPAPAG